MSDLDADLYGGEFTTLLSLVPLTHIDQICTVTMVRKSNRRKKTTPNNNNNLLLKRPPSHHHQLQCLLNRLLQNFQILKRYSLMARHFKLPLPMAHYPHSIFNNRHHKRFRLTRNHNQVNTASHNRLGVTVFIKIFQLMNVRYARLR